MMSSDFHFRNKIPVAILGVKNPLGQQLVNLLLSHPWFEIVALCDAEPFIGQIYADVVPLHIDFAIPESFANLKIISFNSTLPCSLIFSALSKNAKAVEPLFADIGYRVVSNASYPKNFNVPQIVSQINYEYLSLTKKQPFEKGFIVSVPETTIIETTMCLKPLLNHLQIKEIHLLSDGEIKKLQILEILGNIQKNKIVKPDLSIEISIRDKKKQQKKETVSIALQLKEKVKSEIFIQAWQAFNTTRNIQLPSAHFQHLHYFDKINGDSIVPEGIKIEKLRSHSHSGYTFQVTPFHPLLLKAGSALLAAEALVVSGKIYW